MGSTRERWPESMKRSTLAEYLDCSVAEVDRILRQAPEFGAVQYSERGDRYYLLSDAQAYVRRCREEATRNALRASGTSHLYFIWTPLQHPCAVKVGRSSNPAARLRELQCATATKLDLLAVAYDCGDMEKYLHGCLQGHRLQGEWFEMCPAVRAEIAKLSVGFDVAIDQEVWPGALPLGARPLDMLGD